MDHPVVLITGALTGVGRATAVAKGLRRDGGGACGAQLRPRSTHYRSQFRR